MRIFLHERVNDIGHLENIHEASRWDTSSANAAECD